MVSLALAPWAWPLCAALGLGAWQVWPRTQTPLALASLSAALLSAWAAQPGAAVLCMALALVLGACIKEPWAWIGAVGLPVFFAALLRARVAWMPVLPGAMGAWAGLLGLVAVCVASQGLVVSQTFVGVRHSLLAGQAAWCFFALMTGSQAAPIAFVGLLGLLWQQALLRMPLEQVLQRDPPPAVATALLFLGLGGCLGLSGFSAYFQLFIPLMGQAGSAMQAKLGDGFAWLAAVAMLAVLVQTCAFGYFYWQQVLPRAQDDGTRPRPEAPEGWPWVMLALSLAWGLHHYPVSQLAIRALQAIGSITPSPSS